jgi:hypothetical protein
MRAICMFLMLGALLSGSYASAATPAPKECCECAEDMIKRGMLPVDEAKCGCNKPNNEANIAFDHFANSVARVVAHHINNKTTTPDKEISLVITAVIKSTLDQEKIPAHVQKKIYENVSKKLAEKVS